MGSERMECHIMLKSASSSIQRSVRRSKISASRHTNFFSMCMTGIATYMGTDLEITTFIITPYQTQIILSYNRLPTLRLPWN